jgi:hypothetical protein
MVSIDSTTFDDASSARIVSIDVGWANRPSLGNVIVFNVNTNVKTKATPFVGTTMGLLCATGVLNGSFAVTSTADLNLFAPRMSALLATALNNLREFDPAVPSLRASAIDSVAAVYKTDASHPELVAYFFESTAANPIATSHLTGTDQLTGTSVSYVPGATSWQLMLMGLALLALAGAMIAWRTGRAGARAA